MTKSEAQEPYVAEQHGEFGLVTGTTPPGADQVFGMTSRTARLLSSGARRAIVIEIETRDEQRIQVLLSKCLSAMSALEWGIAKMTDEEVRRYVNSRTSDRIATTPTVL